MKKLSKIVCWVLGVILLLSGLLCLAALPHAIQRGYLGPVFGSLIEGFRPLFVYVVGPGNILLGAILIFLASSKKP
jgi:hypothetical protein